MKRTEAEKRAKRPGSQFTGNRRGSSAAAQRLPTRPGSPREGLADAGTVKLARARTPGVEAATPRPSTCQLQLETPKPAPGKEPFRLGNLHPGRPETGTSDGAGPGRKGLGVAYASLRPSPRAFPFCKFFRREFGSRRLPPGGGVACGAGLPTLSHVK